VYFAKVTNFVKFLSIFLQNKVQLNLFSLFRR